MVLKKLPVLILGCLIAVSSFAQELPINLDALEADITTLLSSVGQDLSPRLHQSAVAGNDLVGEARLRGKFRTYFSLAGVTVTMLDGMGGALASTDPDTWKFALISIPKTLKDAIGTDQTGKNTFDMITGAAYPMVSLRLGFGFPLPLGMELLANGVFVPAAALNAATSSVKNPDLSALGARFDMLTIGATLRKPILSEYNGFFRPSLSLGGNYVFSKFGFGMDSFSLSALGDSTKSITQTDMGTLDMSGKFGIDMTTHSFGAVLHLSKTLLWVFTPYVKAAAYYHLTEFTSLFNVMAKLTPKPVAGVAANPITKSINSPVLIRTADMSFILTGGMEVKLLPITITTAVSLDMERPVLEVKTLEPNGFKVNGLSATAAIRIQL